MEPQNNTILNDVQAVSPWYRCAVTSAMVSAAFSLVVLLVLTFNYGKSRVVDTEDEVRLLAFS